jgi:hypothetical protein
MSVHVLYCRWGGVLVEMRGGGRKVLNGKGVALRSGVRSHTYILEYCWPDGVRLKCGRAPERASCPIGMVSGTHHGKVEEKCRCWDMRIDDVDIGQAADSVRENRDDSVISPLEAAIDEERSGLMPADSVLGCLPNLMPDHKTQLIL